MEIGLDEGGAGKDVSVFIDEGGVFDESEEETNEKTCHVVFEGTSQEDHCCCVYDGEVDAVDGKVE